MRFVAVALFVFGFFCGCALFDTVLGDSVSQGQKSVARVIAVVTTLLMWFAVGDR